MKCPLWFHQIITEPDNKTVCIVRIVALVGSLQFLGLGMANYVQHSIFDPQGFAVGLGALIGGVGVALKLKKDTGDQGGNDSH